MSKKAWIIILILIVGVFGFFLINGKSENKDQNTSNSTSNVGDPKKVVANDHIIGSKDNKIVLIEYFDFQCPGCKSLFPSLQQARQKYGDKVTFVQRYFPLTNIHPNALGSARAGEAAAMQGKFFAMEELLFTNQDAWGTLSTGNAQKKFEEYAQQIGLNLETFKKDFASSEVLSRINTDRDKGAKEGVTGTPSLFLNGEKLTVNSENDVAKALDEAISQGKTDPVNYHQ